MIAIIDRLRTSLADRYTVERELGQGGMATVFLATDVRHEREVAIKVLNPELAATIGAERFEREIKLAAKLQHPNILGLYDSGNADGLLFYVMPFVRGESLRDRLEREGQLPVEDAVQLALEVADALGYAHAQGIVHRDIKPENILLSNGHALVADFGIARAATEGGAKLTQTGVTMGTPSYMSPEQASGEPVGPSADIYSLGCVLYEMLSGERPFNGATAQAILSKRFTEVPKAIRQLRRGVPENVERALLKAMSTEISARYKTAAMFAQALSTSSL
ncbi:MAG TPA: serine/threonine-protein kinase, partial [Gemmatimonadaceae bacterium]|nr:serine/threonine-protein kinase [Gemmatimonadaceae bacterium]